MKTRVISTEIWDEEKVFCLNIDTKLLYLVLLTNPYIGQSRFYKINDRQLSTYSGLNVEQIQKCKRDLEEQQMAFFKNGWACITGYGFIECFYKGIKNETAKIKELEKIPKEVVEFFQAKLDTLSIPYRYPIDTPINHKSEIINNKQGTEEASLIPEVLKAFENVDPKNKTYYGNKTQRGACDFLIQEYGFEKVMKVIEILPKTNRLPYMPVVTTPVQLKEKWTQLESGLRKKKAESEVNKNNLI